MFRSFFLRIALFLCCGLILITVSKAQDFMTTVGFPADFSVGDYVEFAKLDNIDAGASGFYEVSISYDRGNIAAAATHIVAVSHANPNIWREAGRQNSNAYIFAKNLNFTIDCNTEYTNSRLRIRAVNNLGVKSSVINVHIKIRAVNSYAGIGSMDVRGKELNIVPLLPMTDEWDLYVGNLIDPASAQIAIKALANGNVGIGTPAPKEKLSVNGTIRAQEIKVETSNWPDYVFQDDYSLMPLTEVDQYIRNHKHLPGVPAAHIVEENGLSLGEMNKLMMKKIEELTLHLIEKDKQLTNLQQLFEDFINTTKNKY